MEDKVTAFGVSLIGSFLDLKGKYMTDAKQEALTQALQYHYNANPPYTAAIGEKKPKIATPDEVIKTARKFEKFLLEKKR